MTTLSAYAAPEAEARPWGRRLAFLTAVVIVLTFTQFWQMPLTGPDGDPEASALIRNLYFPAYGAAMVLTFMMPWSTLKALLRQPILWLLIGDVFVSMLWSVDPATTQRRAIALLFTTIAGAAIATRYEWPTLMEVIATAFAVVVVSCFFLGILVPKYGRMQTIFPGAWRGVWQDKNALGDYMTVGFIVFAATAIMNPQRRWLWMGFATGAIALILLSTSKTSLVTLVIGTGCLFFVWLVKRGGAISVAATFLAVTAILSLVLAIVFVPEVFFSLLGKDATFTGRTNIWTAIIRIMQGHEWSGYGYAVVWTDEDPTAPHAWITKWAGFVAHHSHNSWLETWLAQGYPGVIIWATYFLLTWFAGIWAVYNRQGGYFALPFLAVYSLTTMTESVAFIYNDLLWVIFVAMAVRLWLPETRPVADEAWSAPPPLVHRSAAW